MRVISVLLSFGSGYLAFQNTSNIVIFILLMVFTYITARAGWSMFGAVLITSFFISLSFTDVYSKSMLHSAFFPLVMIGSGFLIVGCALRFLQRSTSTGVKSSLGDFHDHYIDYDGGGGDGGDGD